MTRLASSGAGGSAAMGSLLPRVTLVLVSFFGGSAPAVHSASAKALSAVIEACVSEAMAGDAAAAVRARAAGAAGSVAALSAQAPTPVEALVVAVGSIMTFRYKHAWAKAFDVVATLFRKLGPLRLVTATACAALRARKSGWAGHGLLVYFPVQ